MQLTVQHKQDLPHRIKNLDRESSTFCAVCGIGATSEACTSPLLPHALWPAQTQYLLVQSGSNKPPFNPLAHI